MTYDKSIDKIDVMETKKPRVLITYIESGFGHITSARSIADGLKEKYGDKLDIIEAEIMRDDNDPALIKTEKFLSSQTRATNKIQHYGDFMFAILDIGHRPLMNLVNRGIFHKAVKALSVAFEKRDPDVIISTHYFITIAAIEYKKRRAPEKEVKVICYNPDNNVHVWWDKNCDVFITNNANASNEAIKRRNFDFETVKQVYFTARKCVREAETDKQILREKYSIPKDKFCVMIASGGYSEGKSKDFCNKLLKIKKPLTIIMLTGVNEKMYAYYSRKLQKIKPNITLIPVKFTEKVYELYAAADLLITKSGPNTIADSLFVGTPVMINFCPHPIERASYRLYVKNMGCGLGVFKAGKAKKTVESFIDDPSLLQPYLNNIAQKIDKTKDGSAQIADIVFETATEIKQSN